MADVWNPEQYARFQRERSHAFFDLAGLVQWRPAMRVVDLGCGTGELTRVLHERLAARETVGVDSSPAMLERAGAHAGGDLRFERGDIATWEGAGYDLVFSNAALHWVEGHEALLGRLRAAVAPGGQLAVQVPANHEHPSQLAAQDVARETPFADALGGYVRVSPVLGPAAYAEALFGLGFREQHVQLRVYGHVLASRDDVLEWLKGTTLTDYQRRLPPALYPQFVERYRARLSERLPDTRPYFFTFQRLLLWAMG
ncbi:MAG TPA: methyltransferase domain-containing protein [Polyangia bacterium]